MIESAVFSCFGVTTRCYDNDQGAVSSAVFLANGYVDIGTWWGVTPFVGAGVGGAATSSRLSPIPGETAAFALARSTAP